MSAGNEQQVRVMPHDLAAERSILGAILIENEALDRVLEVVTPDEFYREAHRKIFQAMCVLGANQQPIDLVTLSTTLDKAGRLEEVGGMAYLAQLPDAVPVTTNVLSYARIVNDRWKLRRLIDVADEIRGMAYDSPEPASEILARADHKLLTVTSAGATPTVVTWQESMQAEFTRLEEMAQQQGLTGLKAPQKGLLTGLADLDAILNGLRANQLVIIGGRPGDGKSILGRQIARHAAIHQRARVGYFSIEMDDEESRQRDLSFEARVDHERYEKGALTPEEFERLVMAIDRVYDARIVTDYMNPINIAQIRSRARRWHRQDKLDLIVVDYLQLTKSTKPRAKRNEEVAEVSAGLKALAKELKIPVVALAQLNRALEGRQDKRPMLSDLREAGDIEQDADKAIFIHRPWQYISAVEQARFEPDAREREMRKAEMIVAKNRRGRKGTAPVVFMGEYQAFETLARE